MNPSGNEPQLLIIDDDAEIRYSLHRVLSARGYRVATASSGEEGIDAARRHPPEAIFLDNRMAGMSGLETLQHLRTASPKSMVIIMTAFGTTQTAIEAMKFGAFDYIIKPFDIKKVLNLTENAIVAHRELQAAEGQHEPLLRFEDYEEGIVGSSDAMQSVLKRIGQVAASDVTVMITGESGTGKELVARCIYRHSHRQEAAFQAVNCAAIPENLIESELFGHEKGAFTGATQQRIGRFEQCDRGTLFMDEIGDMALPTQTKILRALQEGEIQRVGGSSTIKVDVRLIAATNKDLEKLVEEGEFREDLYYRLNVMRIRLPALRERKEDIPQLVDFMIQRMSKQRKTRVKSVSADAMSRLVEHQWPGNVRELENVIQRAAVIAQGETILPKDLPKDVRHGTGATPSATLEESLTENAEQPAATQSTAEVSPVPVPATQTKSPQPAELLGSAVEPSVPPVSNHKKTPPSQRATSSSQGTALPFSNQGRALPIEGSEVFDMLYRHAREATDGPILEFIEKEMIQRALNETGGNQVKTSGILGITRATLRKRIDQHQLRY